MPKFPHFSRRSTQITGSVFEKYAAQIADQGDRLVRLHIGDTYLPARYPLPIDSEMLASNPDYNRYCNTFGIEALRAALAQKLAEDNNLSVNPENVLVTNGATNALSASMMALIDPGDEVIVLSPAWPFFFGMVRIAGGRVVDAPLYMELMSSPTLDVQAHLEKFASGRTVALYLNTPNNPSGKVLSEAQLRGIAEFAKSHNLWLISDEAYDGLTFDERPHISVGSLPGMFDRTLSIFTFSKSFMFAGLRLGYVAGNQDAIKSLNKMMVHQLYSPSTIAQQMMVKPVETRSQWLPGVRSHYQELRDIAVETLAMDTPRPESGYFVFFPVDECLQGRDYWQMIDACLEGGVSIAPGNSFGESYDNHIRICFTGESPDRLRVGIERLNKVLG